MSWHGFCELHPSGNMPLASPLSKFLVASSAISMLTSVRLPLSQEIPENFKNLPEYVFDDIVSNFRFIFRFMPHIVSSTQVDELIAFCVTFLTNSEYVKNPYLKSELVTILFHGTWPQYHRQKGVLGDTLTNDKFANDHLLHALMKWYIGEFKGSRDTSSVLIFPRM